MRPRVKGRVMEVREIVGVKPQMMQKKIIIVIELNEGEGKGEISSGSKVTVIYE
jgi:hypothetical protein